MSGKRRPLPDKPCAGCGQPFTPDRRERKYCHPNCHNQRTKLWHEKQRRIMELHRKAREELWFCWRPIGLGRDASQRGQAYAESQDSA